MAKCFSFISREVEIQFFEQDPVIVRMVVCDKTDTRIREYADAIKATESFEDRKAALAELIGPEALEAILARSPIADSYALRQIQAHVFSEYIAVKEKNLFTAKAGREK